MIPYVRSEREILEEKLERLYEERHKAIGDEEKFKQLCREIGALELKFYTWDHRGNWLSRTNKVPYQPIQLLTLKIR